jgi:hypothetical protein
LLANFADELLATHARLAPGPRSSEIRLTHLKQSENAAFVNLMVRLEIPI